MSRPGPASKGRPGLRPCTPSGVIELLEARGIAVVGAPRHAPLAAGSADTVASHFSGPLSESVRNFLKISDNLTGELLVKSVGASVSGPPGTFEKGLAAERRYPLIG